MKCHFESQQKYDHNVNLQDTLFCSTQMSFPTIRELKDTLESKAVTIDTTP